MRSHAYSRPPWSTRLSTVIGVIAIVSTLAPTPVAAQSTEELSRARAQFQQATELEQGGNWAAALKMFREVGQVRMTPQVRYHIALCEEHLGRLVVALGGYELALPQADAVGEDFRTEVTASIDELRARIPKLTIQRGAGAEDAKIEVDGVLLGNSSIGTPFPIDPGPHAVTASAPGFQAFRATVEMEERGEQTVLVELRPVPKDVVVVPPVPGPRDPGPAEPPSMLMVYVTGGVGIAGLAAAGGFFVLRQSALSDLEEQCPSNDCGMAEDPEAARDTYDNLKRYNLVSQIALGVGVAGIGTATALWFVQSSKKPSATGWRAVPMAAGSDVGVTISKAF